MLNKPCYDLYKKRKENTFAYWSSDLKKEKEMGHLQNQFVFFLLKTTRYNPKFANFSPQMVTPKN